MNMSVRKFRILFWVVLASLVWTAGCSGQELSPDPNIIQRQSPKPTILDVDMAHEDMNAALFLLAHPDVDVLAITVVGTGEAHCEEGVENALGLTVLSGQSNIPVACGRRTPLSGEHAFPDEWRRDADNAYGVKIPDGGQASPLSAPELMIATLEESEQKVSLIAVGPLTNIAEALQESPGITSKIDTIFIMGGAVEAGGNVGPSGVGIDNDLAEWNIYIDPQAANIVFESGAPIVLVPLDATQDVPVTRKFYNALKDHSNTPEANLVYEILTANLDFIESGGFQFWDSLTAAIAADGSIAEFENLQLLVVEEEGPEVGATKPSPAGENIRVAVSADRERFEQLFLTILNWVED